ncbi:MAG: hypothetical protein ACOYT7_02415 [Patescibacteria group bacterium]
MRDKSEKNKKFLPSTKLLYVAGTLTLAGIVYLTLEMTTSGASLSKLEKEEAGLLAERESLNSELIHSSSLGSFEKASESLGFIKAEKTLYITQEEAVAKLP